MTLKWLEEAIDGARGRGCPKCLVGRSDMMADPAFACDMCNGTGVPHFALIAAAPELLAALKDLFYADYESDGAYGTVAIGVLSAGDGGLIKRCRAAIAKAEGR